MEEREIESEDHLFKKLGEIYSDTTVAHIIHPHNNASIPEADGYALNQSGCGESMKIWLKIRDNVVRDAGFWTDGCAATIACGSMATDMVTGKSVMEAFAIVAEDIAEALVDLPEGNMHCAELAASAVRAAVKDHLAIQQQPWKRLYRK
jgi:nitrogen fixation protein NifU and related proteins